MELYQKHHFSPYPPPPFIMMRWSFAELAPCIWKFEVFVILVFMFTNKGIGFCFWQVFNITHLPSIIVVISSLKYLSSVKVTAESLSSLDNVFFRFGHPVVGLKPY